MGWNGCVLFGAIISATDPVAVVALLKELGTSKRIGTLIEGESLLNDGTAMVIFMIALEMVAGENITYPEMGRKFVQLSFGGPLLGLLSAVILVLWLSRVHNKPVLEANLTVTFAYITFYIAERPEVHVSGILALVVLGLFMARAGKTRISAESEHVVHSVWQSIGFSAETIIFCLSGLMIGARASEVLDWASLGKIIVLYVLLHIIRFTLLMMFLPLMNCFGYPIDWKHCALMTWGALRGALALFLALIVERNQKVEKKTRELILLYCSAIAMLTLVVNGTTTGAVVERLGLSKETPTSKKFMYMFVQQVKAHSRKRQAQLINNQINSSIGLIIDQD
jgi:NhaP-type Na+/H+ or K+/H+ antiporter